MLVKIDPAAAQNAAKFENEPGMNTDIAILWDKMAPLHGSRTSASNNQGNASEYNNEN
jgi:hypothetical protein